MPTTPSTTSAESGSSPSWSPASSAALPGPVGASGSGKSSALRAGLLPALAGGVLPGSAAWRQGIIRPGEHPLAELERVSAARSTKQSRRCPPTAAWLLVVDQFEEVFNSTRDEAERNRFIDLITGERDNLKVVLAMRADHYGHCAAYPTAGHARGAQPGPRWPLDPRRARSVIEHPPSASVCESSQASTEALLPTSGDEPGSLPLLSTALLELWQAREAVASRSPRTDQGGVHGAVARWPRMPTPALSEDEREIARSIFLRLAGTGEGEGVVRRRVPLSEFDQADQRVGERPCQAHQRPVADERRRLRGGCPRGTTARVAAPATVARRRRRRPAVRLHLIGAARDWEARGREPGDLYRSARWPAALDWAAEHRVDLNELEREFLEQSRSASEAEADRQRRTNRRLRTLSRRRRRIPLVALAAGGFAVYQAKLQARRSNSQVRASWPRRQSLRATTIQR